MALTLGVDDRHVIRSFEIWSGLRSPTGPRRSRPWDG